MEIFCFFLGIFYAYTLHPLSLLSGLCLFFITPRYALIAFFFLGLFISFIHLKMVLPAGFPQQNSMAETVLEGVIASIPLKTPYKTQFLLETKALNGQKAKGLVQLSWFSKTPPLKVGQIWQFTVKIKKPHNFLNPGSLDYVNSLASKHVYWIGTISSKDNRLLNGTSSLSWLALREKYARDIAHLAPDKKTAGIIEALTLNLTTHISQEDWDLFRRTGTTHLFGISGEHIALIAGLITSITKILWSRSVRCCLWFPALSLGGVSGFAAALLYAFLAGFAPPVQRALIGSFFYTLYCLGKQRFTAWQVWRYALFGVLFFEPHVIFMQGFYFSFLAVCCLLLTQQRWKFTGYKANLALQLSCLMGLMPLSLYWYSYGSINGFIANLFAIPLVGLCIVPLSLITMMVSSTQLAGLLIKPLSLFIALLYKLLIWTECLAGINVNWTLTHLVYALVLMGAFLIGMVLPVKPFKYCAWLWLILPLFPAKPSLHYGEARVEVLDVGQGLAVAIQTQNHALLYDTGDQFFQGSDLGVMVILPFYKTLGLKKIDKVIISHPDKDHRGGLKSIELGIKVDELLVNDLAYYDHGVNCHKYPKWQWDGVFFEFLPIYQSFNDKNNNSCILQISSPQAKLLLTGDIEKEGEDYLVRYYSKQLASEVLIVPHHGSKTSSSYRFLLEVAPLYAIASLGLDNRFHFPHAKTLFTMKALNSSFIRTDECGMVELILPALGSLQKPRCYSGKEVVPGKDDSPGKDVSLPTASTSS